MNETLLIVDDEPRIRRIVQMALEDRGYAVLTAGSAEEAEEIVSAREIDLVIADLQLPGRSGLDLLGDLRRDRPAVPVILITAFGTVETAVEAIKAGAFDYVLKPFGIEELEGLVVRAIEAREGVGGSLTAREVAGEDFAGMVARSPGMVHVRKVVDQVADAPTTILITGETGVGKEVVARALHQRSNRRSKPFVAVNCAAIPEDLLEAELFGAARGAYTGAIKDRPGKLEVADGGTLFLDEIGDMPLGMQPKLLRVLQEGAIERLGSNVTRNVDVRVVAATHRDLARLVQERRFREDLYYRINVFPIAVPPLRKRTEDIEPLSRAALRRFAARLGVQARLTPAAMEQLRSYPWPGNVRELMNVLERAVLLSENGLIEHVELPATEGPSGAHPSGSDEVRPLSQAVAEAERAAIAAALERTGGNKAQAARLLGISVRTLWYKLEKLGMR